ncbi:hypothetical protein [Virgibacillus siamensis]|uniref:hypothetical protein n=1 Tax=Virgibacillus siamensis TaxID=480071 RepID=UPI000985B4DE|nr:hypothetical protein [Virgibacillus siamensis]
MKISLNTVLDKLSNDDLTVLKKLNINPSDLQTKHYSLECLGVDGKENVHIHIGAEELEKGVEIICFRNQGLGEIGGLLHSPYAIDFSTVKTSYIYDFISNKSIN